MSRVTSARAFATTSSIGVASALPEHAADLLARWILPHGQTTLHTNLEGNPKCAVGCIRRTEVFVDLVLERLRGGVESADVQQRAIGDHGLSPSPQVVAMQELVDAHQRVL